MTTKFDNFKVALEKLCEEHGIWIENGFYPIIVWDNPYSPEEGVKEDSDIWMEDETGHLELNYGMDAEG